MDTITSRPFIYGAISGVVLVYAWGMWRNKQQKPSS